MDIPVLRKHLTEMQVWNVPPFFLEDSLVTCPRGEKAVLLPLTRLVRQEETVWHYTRSVSASLIGDSGILRATHYKDLADSSEIQYGIDLILRAYRESPTGQYPLEVRRWVKSLVSRSVYRLFDFPLYVLCMSLSGNVEYLWENYAGPDGSSLGTPVSEQNRLAVLDATGRARSNQYNFANWRVVEYRADRQLELAKGLIEYLFQCYPDPQAAGFGLLYFVPFMKEHKFQSEEEVRFTVMGTGKEAIHAEHTREDGKRFVELTFGGMNIHNRNATPSGLSSSGGKVVRHPSPLPVSSTWQSNPLN